MKFFIKADLKENLNIPPEQLRELSIKHIELMLNYEQEGKILFGAVGSGERFGLYVVEVESNDELEEFLFSWPLYSLCKIEIFPLSSLEFRLHTLTDILK